jgi:Na+-transporting methylmalonyl-CoA/oxaloacetate decarboxylase gamma subunit
MFLQEAPANTFNYMVLGFGVIFVVMSLFIVSLVVRFRNLSRDLELLDDIDDKEQT